ncbi:trypsin-like peptidase domain-containing protein [Mycolicibacterium sp. BiH015]|uniref:S1C family serine protease n=1 Tax=Mycolicibacterium sp. BiH015 TaxID=3018808 RepID=UPI0022DFA165|nr:trypsin-like peptidase domain-containing protein [Mycolicibacterium sp. BiH015]MDA2893027.1 trypsin-like peptidase domain-containing protein [Mycolicibacterium sp. BiH015]
MTFEQRFDLGAHPSGPAFLPPDTSGAPARPEPVPAVPTRVRVGTAPRTAPPVPDPLAVPAAPRRSTMSALLIGACLVIGAAAGGGAGFLVADADRGAVIRQSPPPASGPLPAGSTQSASLALLPSVVQISAGNSIGSGFAIDAQGRIMTNSHVIEGYSRVQVRMADGRRSSARVVGADPATDVAVLELAGTPPPAAALGVSNGLAIGQPVIAVGAPLGLRSTVTAGIISAVDRTARLGSNPGQSLLQTDASINPGNSGGPLANLDGQVIGMNTAIATVGGSEAGNIGIGFAVPIDRAVEVAREIIQNG